MHGEKMINPRFHISVSDSHFRYKFHAGCQRASRGDEGVICKKCPLKREKKKIEKQMELAERALNQKVLTFLLMTILQRQGGPSDWE